MGKRILVIETARLSHLEAVASGEPGHHSIRPVDQRKMPEWMASREEEPARQAEWHDLTLELLEAIVTTDLQETR